MESTILNRVRAYFGTASVRRYLPFILVLLILLTALHPSTRSIDSFLPPTSIEVSSILGADRATFDASHAATWDFKKEGMLEEQLMTIGTHGSAQTEVVEWPEDLYVVHTPTGKVVKKAKDAHLFNLALLRLPRGAGWNYFAAARGGDFEFSLSTLPDKPFIHRSSLVL